MVCPEVGSRDDSAQSAVFSGALRRARIAGHVAPKFKKMSLELGGKNPAIIFEDADFDEALKVTLRSSFANQGQICLCGSRVLVRRSIYDRFRDALVAKASAMVAGDPLNPSTKLGAVVSEGHMHKILGHIELAKEEGGTVLCGGGRLLRASNRDSWRPRSSKALAPIPAQKNFRSGGDAAAL